MPTKITIYVDDETIEWLRKMGINISQFYTEAGRTHKPFKEREILEKLKKGRPARSTEQDEEVPAR